MSAPGKNRVRHYAKARGQRAKNDPGRVRSSGWAQSQYRAGGHLPAHGNPRRQHAAFAVGRHISNIAYHLLAEHSTYRELGPSYFEQRRAEHLKRRCLDQLRNLGFQATLTPSQRQHDA
jgi:hypothetical protein